MCFSTCVLERKRENVCVHTRRNSMCALFARSDAPIYLSISHVCIYVFVWVFHA